MTTQVSILTARGMSAIASVALAGPKAQNILAKIFHTQKNNAEGTVLFQAGQVVYGSIVDGDRLIDEVVVGAEDPDVLTIHSHGNPLITQQIVTLIQHHGATLTDAESFALDRCKCQSRNMIEAEARLAMGKSATLLGAKILKSQIEAGLCRWGCDLLAQNGTVDPDLVKSECQEILIRSKIAARIINGVKIVIAGPPNSGKSTLLNCLAGDQQVIVSDTAGTTRDWVSTTCHVGPIHVEFIDTAGLDDVLALRDNVEQAAQQMTKELLETCDLVLHVTDCSKQETEYGIQFDRPVIKVYNKRDLLKEHKHSGTQEPRSVYISAKENIGIDTLIEIILKTLQVNDFLIANPVVFTPRQHEILAQLVHCDQKTDCKTRIDKLLGKFMQREDA